MTKARARERAKANAMKKSRKQKAQEDKGDVIEDKPRSGKFDAKSNSMKNASGGGPNLAGMKRGSARSR